MGIRFQLLLCQKKYDTHFYPFIGSANRSVWYKITLPYSGATFTSNRWFMISMDLVIGGPYSNGTSGKIFLAYFFTYNTSLPGYIASNVYGIGIGTIINSVVIKYDIANPAIFYIKASNNDYNSIAIENLTANDSAPAYEFRDTTISAIAEGDIPSTASSTVPITFLSSQGTNILSTNSSIKLTTNNAQIQNS